LAAFLITVIRKQGRRPHDVLVLQTDGMSSDVYAFPPVRRRLLAVPSRKEAPEPLVP
jgi:hypothetical protein